MTNAYDYGYSTGSQRSIWYYLVFPIDAWRPSSGGDGFDEQKAHEIWPLMIFLLPAIVLIAGLSLGLGFFSSLFFYGIEAFLIALVCKFYAHLGDFGLVMELFFNFWLSFIALSFCFTILFSIITIFT